jgi:hypothetical protein
MRFPESFQASREAFRRSLPAVQRIWPDANLSAYPVDENSDLTIDYISADATTSAERIFILTTGLHGIEGYLGSVVCELFIQRFLSGFDPSVCGVMLMHALNPWGMENRRRTNCSNVDLNRNFLQKEGEYDPAFNPDYLECGRLINPSGRINSWFRANAEYIWQLVSALMKRSPVGIRRALTLGQYSVPKGVYYGGDAEQEESRAIKRIIMDVLLKYSECSLVDVHTGYGPKDQLTLLHSPLETKDVTLLKEQLQYPLVVKADIEGFFEITGDMVDYFYARLRKQRPETRFYGVTLEFGTIGDTFWADLSNLRALVFENRAWHYGCKNEWIMEKVKHEFDRMFAPPQFEWLDKAQQAAEYTLERVLEVEGFISNTRERSPFYND